MMEVGGKLDPHPVHEFEHRVCQNYGCTNCWMSEKGSTKTFCSDPCRITFNNKRRGEEPPSPRENQRG